MNTTEKAIVEIVAGNPEGITHVEIVKGFLERGYKLQDNLSAFIHKATARLIDQGVLSKNLTDRQIHVA